MARLAHPQVVAIHDAGSYQNQVYVVMEMVEGGTLREWLAHERRSWREVLAILLEAGRRPRGRAAPGWCTATSSQTTYSSARTAERG